MSFKHELTLLGTPDNDAVHVKSPAGRTARRLQDDTLHPRLSTISPWPACPLTAAAGLSAATNASASPISLLNHPGGMLSE